jgi:hypothetical protein
MFREILSKRFSIELEELLVEKVLANVQVKVIAGTDGNLKNEFGIMEGSLVYVERCRDPTQSLVVKHVEAAQFLIDVSFNLPGENVFDQDISIDKRKTVRDLKTLIGSKIGLQPDDFKLCRNLSKHEYKNDAQV